MTFENKTINQYAKENDVKVVVTSSFRKKDAKLIGVIVAPAKMSNHLAGHAIDMNILFDGTLYESKSLKASNLVNLPPNVALFIEEIRLDESLRWGGDFDTEDPVHIDDALNSDTKEWQNRYTLCQEQSLKVINK